MRRTALEGGCYVVGPDDLDWREHPGWREAPIIDGANGATALSQWFVEIEAGGVTPVLAYPGSDVVLYALRGEGLMGIAGREFPLDAGTGGLVRQGEGLRLTAGRGTEPLALTLTICPECPSPRHLDRMPDRFDATRPVRTAGFSTSPLESMGDRFYQVLVGEEIGSTTITQFVGAIPLSKAAAHYHHYEEAITILSGKGRMWTGDRSAPVVAGSMIFLPMRQIHSLECTDPGGIRLAGHFYPAGSPAENYRG